MSTTTSRALGRRAREVGSATLEHIAAMALAALLIGAMVLPMHPAGTALREKVCAVFAAVAGSVSCGGASTPPPGATTSTFDPKPARCKVTEHGEKVSAEVQIVFIKIGDNSGFVETTYSDGTVTYTATDGASAGLTGGFGAELDIAKVEAGAKVEFGGDYKADYGSTWVFKDAPEAERMKKQLDDYLEEQKQLATNENYGWRVIFGHMKEPPKQPQQSVRTIEVSGSGQGQVGISLPWQPGSASDTDKGPKLGIADAGFKFGGSRKWTQITDSVLKTTTYTTAGEGYGQRNGTIGPLSGEVKGVLGSSMAVTRDQNDQVVKVTLATTHEHKETSTGKVGVKDFGGQGSDADSSGDLIVTTAVLDVKTPEQRALVDSWLHEQATDTEAFVSPETYYPDRLVSGDPFQNLMYTNATVSDVDYDNVSNKSGFAAKVKLGIALGVDLSLETTDSKATAATYLDAANGADGIRPPVDFPACVSK